MLAFGLKEIKTARTKTRSSIFGLRPQKIKAARKKSAATFRAKSKARFLFRVIYGEISALCGAGRGWLKNKNP
jgi:hypothetical protein